MPNSLELKNGMIKPIVSVWIVAKVGYSSVFYTVTNFSCNLSALIPIYYDIYDHCWPINYTEKFILLCGQLSLFR